MKNEINFIVIYHHIKRVALLSERKYICWFFNCSSVYVMKVYRFENASIRHWAEFCSRKISLRNSLRKIVWSNSKNVTKRNRKNHIRKHWNHGLVFFTWTTSIFQNVEIPLSLSNSFAYIFIIFVWCETWWLYAKSWWTYVEFQLITSQIVMQFVLL